MEWAPLAGTLPPMTDAEWQRLYDLYQQIPQYALVNQGFGLAGFKRIFWLEWTHRMWGRLIGLAFLVPLIWFWATGRHRSAGCGGGLACCSCSAGCRARSAGSWWRRASSRRRTAVSPYRLVIHLALALALYAAMLWTGLTVLRPLPRGLRAAPSLRWMALLSCGAVGLTILAGGFVAGIHAGLDYNTFPLMDGRLVPAGYARLSPLLRNLTENIAAVQFNHRLLATLALFVVMATVAVAFSGPVPPASRLALIALTAAVVVQYLLGVATLLAVVPVTLAALHQLSAALLLTAAVVVLHTARQPPRARP